MDLRPASFFLQKTIKRPAAISGRGIHTGQLAQLRLLPAGENTGIRFRRVDAGNIEIPALATQVSSLELATTLGRDDVTVSTVEHLMAALHATGIDNLVIELDGPEVPILDGSALPYLYLLKAVGTQTQTATRRILAVTAPLVVSSKGRSIRVSPYPGLRISYGIHFEGTPIGRQEIDLSIDSQSFEEELAPARTFALRRDVDRLHAQGLGLGGTPDNCVVFDESGTFNTALRFADEPVRHKALDAIGDLALLGCPLWAHVEVECGGHLMHFRLMEQLRSQTHCWTWMSAESPALPELSSTYPPLLAEAMPGRTLWDPTDLPG